MKNQSWFQAHVRWGVMVNGKGLQHWEEAVYLLRSENRDRAFQRVLEIGHREEYVYQDGRKWVETRLAEIVALDELGIDRTEFKVELGSKKARERFPFEHNFDPAGAPPLELL
jgi:hypothetical protein